MRLHLRPPDSLRLPFTFQDGKGNSTKLELILRVFTLEDDGFLMEAGGEDWLLKVGAGDFALGLRVLAHQVENREAVEAAIGAPLEKQLRRLVVSRPGNASGLVVALDKLNKARLPLERVKKKSRLVLRRLSITLLHISCGAAVAFLLLTQL